MKNNDRHLPIGIFDSGVGGLTVLKAIRESLPAEDLLYLGDTARLPYGTKSPESITRYARQATRRLQQEGIKLLVVACNTASAVALDILCKELAPLPILGVIEPGAAKAVAASPGGRHLVLATEATCRFGAYRKAIASLDHEAEVTEIACELLVALAEEGWTDGPIAPAIIRRYIGATVEASEQANSIILGCTHFPILHGPIAEIFADQAAIVDSASTTAEATEALLADLALENPRNPGASIRFLATDGPSRFARVGGRFLGQELTVADIELVDL